LRLILRADSPLVISGKPEAGNNFVGERFIPGRTVRGALAARANPSAPGFMQSDSYPAFRDLFVLGNLRFTALHPLLPDNNGKFHVVGEIPKGLKSHRDVEQDIRSVLTDGVPTEKRLHYKDYKGLVALVDYDTLPRTVKAREVAFQTQMHVQIDPRFQRNSTGDLFSYEANPAGRYFVGEIELDDPADWPAVADLLGINLDAPFTLRVGKGIRRGYGACTAVIQEVVDETSVVASGMPLINRLAASESPNTYTLTLASDMIVLDRWGRAYQRFEEDWLAEELGVAQVKINNQMVLSTWVEGFDVRSGLPYWRDLALERGSSVLIQLSDSMPVETAQRLEEQGIGLRRHEGFGRVIINHPLHHGLKTGFAPPIEIPKSLHVEDLPDPTEKMQAWRSQIDKTLKDTLRRHPDVDFRGLARLLAENASRSHAALNDLMENGIGTLEYEERYQRYGLDRAYARRRESEKSQKQTEVFAPAVIEQLGKTLGELSEQYDEDFWQPGVIMLAQVINEVANARDRDQ
jgi:CRISPR-associated protein Csx10